MKSSLNIKTNYINSINPANVYLPEYMQKGVSKLISIMQAKKYDNNCKHLPNEQK